MYNRLKKTERLRRSCMVESKIKIDLQRALFLRLISLYTISIFMTSAENYDTCIFKNGLLDNVCVTFSMQEAVTCFVICVYILAKMLINFRTIF